MNKLSLNRFSPLPLGTRLTLKNRVVVPPMASSTAETNGIATAKTIEHYARLARSGAGLVIVEYTYVHASGRSEENQLGISSDAQAEGLALISKAIQQSGALSGIQLTHGGGKSSRELTRGEMMGPSAIPVPVKGDALETPVAMGPAEILLWKKSFTEAADRAVAAGFDLVEFHSAHGYGLNQWLSPLTNKREDEYGGSLTARARLLLEIVSAVRAAHSALLISVRMPGQDFLEGGMPLADAIELAKLLQTAGVSVLHISSGIGGWRRPTVRTGEGYLVEEAAAIQAQVSVPVIGVGGIESGKFIDQSLGERKFSLAAVGRAILKDPQGWGGSQLCACA